MRGPSGISNMNCREPNAGLAPGTAFGEGGAPFFRLCFARDPRGVSEAVAGLTK